MIQKIITDKNRFLLLPSDPVDLDNTNVTFSTTITDMIDTVVDAKGFGIAAPQIGVRQRIIVVLNQKKNEYEVYINPKIITRSGAKKMIIEASLSRPGKVAKMRRNKQITVEAYNTNLDRVIIKAKGSYAAIFQHLVDHLDGKIIGMAGNIAAISSLPETIKDTKE